MVVIMIHRKTYRTFPIFFSYLLCQVATFCILFPIHNWCGYTTYFYAYWITSGISLVFGFKVIYEIFLDVFRPYHSLKDLGAVMFNWAGLVMLLACLVVAAASRTPERGILVEAIFITQRGVRVIQCGMVLFLLVFSKYLGVSRKDKSFGIALGFGLYAATELAGFALYSSGRFGIPRLASINMVSYSIATLIWMGYSLIKSPERVISANLLMPQRWEQSLADIQSPVTSDSLIPMFEGMVDRAILRTVGHEGENTYSADVPTFSAGLIPDCKPTFVSPAVFRSPHSAKVIN